jgi:hypothetical protein
MGPTCKWNKLHCTCCTAAHKRTIGPKGALAAAVQLSAAAKNAKKGESDEDGNENEDDEEEKPKKKAAPNRGEKDGSGNAQPGSLARATRADARTQAETTSLWPGGVPDRASARPCGECDPTKTAQGRCCELKLGRCRRRERGSRASRHSTLSAWHAACREAKPRLLRLNTSGPRTQLLRCAMM